MTAPALAALTAHIVAEAPLPDWLPPLDPAAVAPDRLFVAA